MSVTRTLNLGESTVLSLVDEFMDFCISDLGDSCTSDTYCLGAIPASTCNNSICTCAAGYIKQNKICVKIGTVEKPGMILRTNVITYQQCIHQ